jgi:hypothetical protein
MYLDKPFLFPSVKGLIVKRTLAIACPWIYHHKLRSSCSKKGTHQASPSEAKEQKTGMVASRQIGANISDITSRASRGPIYGTLTILEKGVTLW